MTMTTGELDFENLFRFSSGASSPGEDTDMNLPFTEVSIVVWVFFLIMMPILYTNLLVSAYTI